jgi:hypothetical protein
MESAASSSSAEKWRVSRGCWNWRIAALVGVATLAALTGCGDSGADDSSLPRIVERQPPERRSPAEGEKPEADVVVPSHCPAGLPSCRTTEGQIVYVERVDPDGDGDAHFVVVDPQGITLPGLTAIDVRKGLRPDPLPEPGDLISAAGPVQTGSYGQSQIHALELHVAGG